VSRALSAPVRAVGKALPKTIPGVRPRAAMTAPSVDPSSVVDCAVYRHGARLSGRPHYADALRTARTTDDAFVWVGLHEPTEAEFADIASTFDLHPLAVEDAVRAYERPKLERYGDVTFVVLKTALYCEHAELMADTEIVEIGEVFLFIGRDFVISVRHGNACRLVGVRARLEERPDLLGLGPWSVFHAVCDNVVDTYVDVAEALEEDIDELEREVFGPSTTEVQRIYQLKRELVEFKRAVLPLARPLDGLVAGQIPTVPMELRRYFRDVTDHHVRVTEQISGFDDLLTSILQADLARIGIQQNSDMRKISAWAAIAVALTVVTGTYGMNFANMPELHWRYGYFVVLAAMAAVSIGLFRVFKKTGWL
jgi:magnesium transporter